VAPLDLARSVAARPVLGLRAAAAGNPSRRTGRQDFFYREKKITEESNVMRVGVGVGGAGVGGGGGG
jgi:hypothetical protein